MLNLKVQAAIVSINAEFAVNVKAVHNAVDNGNYNEITLANTQVVYGLSNRKAQVCYVFDNFCSEQDRKDILFPTKGYAVARIMEVANAYIASKNVVVEETKVSNDAEVDALLCRIAELEAENAKVKTELSLSKSAVGILNRKLKEQTEAVAKALASVF